MGESWFLNIARTMCKSSWTMVLFPVMCFLFPIDIVLQHSTWYCQRCYNTRKNIMMIIFRFWLLLASNHTERGRCQTLGRRYIHGLITLSRTNYIVILKHSECLVKRSRWCHSPPIEGVVWKTESVRNTYKWSGDCVRESLKVCTKYH